MLETTPVLVGVAQTSERLDDADYAALSPVELAARAARAAIADAGGADLASRIDTVAGVRQFDASFPGAMSPLGSSDNFPRSVAARIGADPALAILETSGGQSPQHLVTELAGRIAAGASEVALVVGAEAMSTMAHYAFRDDRPDWTERVGGQLDDRGFGLEGLVSRYQANHGLDDAVSQYAIFDNARRAARGDSGAEYSAAIGRLFAPFSEVAATNPHSSAPVARTAEELMTVTEQNRMIAEPYPRYVIAREKVNQGAAVLLTSVAVARELGIAQDRWVYLRGHADIREQALVERASLGEAPGSVLASKAALTMAGVGLDDVATFDLYSCFSSPVSMVCDGLGLATDDPRGLTVTGGLPFFGGPGNNYSMHAIVETVARARATPGSFGFVGANGGTMSKYSVGVYSTAYAAWEADTSARLQARIDALPRAVVAEVADGWGIVESWTVKHRRSGERTGVVVGRLEADGRRFLATTLPGDDTTVDLLASDEAPGARVYVRSEGRGNRVSVSLERLEELAPTPPVGFRDSYEHLQVVRDGHVLEITIDRPDARNALHPDANQELADVFDAYAADADLWVAILTGAGDASFCAGNDLAYTASGQQVWFPTSGFGGLTNRRGLTKPVIAAVNGAAYGGGFELVLACHLVVADEQARFALSEVKVGLVAAFGGVVRLPRVLPPAVAHELILTGRAMDAAEAERRGLVTRVAPAGTALDVARELAAEIVAVSPTSVRISLRLIEEAAGHADVVDALSAPSSTLDDLLFSADALEGVSAFVAKRAPRWVNR
ncbi:unannotated protein [freshwater metagenome]|uniref:Unannotated protein n=1 Tax=freshwater metagenome TaxID=449393 RepID=A0A6J6PQ43_9ZZZZ